MKKSSNNINKIKRVKKTKKILIGLAVGVMILGLSNVLMADAIPEDNNDENDVNQNYQINTLNDGNIKYTEFFNKNKDLVVKDYYRVIPYEEYSVNEPNTSSFKKSNETNTSYTSSTILLNSGNDYLFTIDAPSEGLYAIGFDYYLNADTIIDTEVQMTINSDIQYYETKQLTFSGEWVPTSNDFAKDRYGNEIVPSSNRMDSWYYNQYLADGSSLHDSPLYVKLNKGSNEVSLHVKSGSVYIGNLYLESPKELITYEDYLNSHKDAPVYDGGLIKFGAEYMESKSSLDIRIYSLQDSMCSRYETKHKLLNAVYEASWDGGNQSITYNLNVEKAGLYALSFKYLQTAFIDMPVARTIYINGEVPYKELYAYNFYYGKTWKNETLHNANGNLLVYLNAGDNSLTMKVNMDIYRYVVEEIDRIMDEMNDMAIRIKDLTNGQSDKYRDWKITKFIPTITDDLNRWADELDGLRDYLKDYSINGKYSNTFNNLKMSSKKLRKLAKDPDQIPNNMTSFTEGSASVSQLLGDLILLFNKNPMGLEQIYLSNGTTKLPKTKENFFKKFGEGTKRFFLSFFAKEYSVNGAKDDELEIWVNRSRQYVEIMQQMADNAGIKAKFSIMPDQNKLILANTSGDLPDLALGISNWIPYDLALRGITVDLRQFEGYEELVKNFAKGAMIPYAYADGMYGIPETQDFWITFYRTDIYESLNLPCPQTWDELLGQLPILQRLGYNFYDPLSSYRGLKPYVATLCYFYQFGASGRYGSDFTGSLYAYDGMSTTLSDECHVEALKFMTNLFTIYDVPEETLSFYNSFRYGTLPIGIANSGVYTSLLIAAPEINGNWSVDLHIGTENVDGSEIVRYSTSGSQGITMFESCKNKQQAWDFIEWWMSTETQTNFIQRLYGMYGLEYLWYSANLNAFDSLPIDYNHKKVMIEQLKNWSMEASRIPAAYMLERSISDAYSKVVFNGMNCRIALDDAVIESNREIIRKMTEFKYYENGHKVKDYVVPTIYNIDDWLTEH